MIKTMQVLKWMISQNLSMSDIMAEFTEIVDNGRSQYFELSDSDICSIQKIYFDESKFESACQVAGLSMEYQNEN
jgi:hypothetical protein